MAILNLKCVELTVGTICIHLAVGRFVNAHAVLVLQPILNVIAYSILYVNIDSEFTIAIAVREFGHNLQVTNVSLLASIHIYFASNTREAPEVLVLSIGTVAPTHNLHSYEVLLARTDVRSDIELGLNLRILTVADFLSVDP